MSGRSWWFAVTCPGVWIPWALGAGLIAADISLLGGALLGFFGLARLQHVFSHRDLDQRLRLKGEKQSQRIERMLTAGERAEVLALDSYCNALREAGAEASLCDLVKDESWKILKLPGIDSAARLRRLRQGLPAPTTEAPASEPDSTLGQQIQQELDLLRVTHREVELV